MEEYLRNLSNYLYSLGQQIGMNNKLLLDNVDQMIKKTERQNQKRRRKKEGDQLVVSGDLFLGMNRFYDDGSNALFQLSKVLTGKNSVYILDFQGLEKNEKFGIFFENEGIWVVGDKRKVKPACLLDYFVKAAGSFCPGVSGAIIGKLLYDHWAVSIEQTENRLTVPVLAGWHNGDFLHAGNFMFKKTTDFPSIPVLEKDFPNVVFTEEIVQVYFQELQKIFRWKERLLITLYPFVGILSSIFDEMHVQVDISLNFVEIDPIDRKVICSWLKIFNRRILLPRSLDLKETELRHLIARSNDEVLIFDATEEAGETDYHRRKLKKNIAAVIAGMRHQGNVTEEKRLHGSFACAFFSNDRILEAGVQNIMVDHEFYKDDERNVIFVEHQAMEAVLSDFVSYVKRDMEKIWNMIMKNRRGEENDDHIFASVYGILKGYWDKKGVDFHEMLKIPTVIEWADILGLNKYDDEDLVETFIMSVRKKIGLFYAIEKKREGDFKQGAIFYSPDYIWIPTKVMRMILNKEGLFLHLNTILLILKRKGVLITDRTGFSRKLQMSGKILEVYQMKRNFFNSPGFSEIIDLAKGGGL